MEVLMNSVGVMTLIEAMGHEQIVFCQDKTVGLKAIIAVHSTQLGPALGGCRFWNYKTYDDALIDVLKLSKGMTYKASISNLALGGGKAVIIGDPAQLKSKALFARFGQFVETLSGRYITAEDVNVTVDDINHVVHETKHVVGVTNRAGGSGDPSPYTALGVFQGIRASLMYKKKIDQLSGVRVAIQGCGAVGGKLAALLHKEGAELVLSDINSLKAKSLAQKLGAEYVDPDDIHKAHVDVYAPCALGGTLNEKTISELNTDIIAGGANNQLLHEEEDGLRLQERGILYAPDYVINAGGLINVYHEIQGYNEERATKDTLNIYDTLIKIFELAEKEHQATYVASNRIAEERLRLENNADNGLEHKVDCV